MVALPPRQFDRNRPRTRSPITSGTNGMETSRLSTAFSTSQPRRPKKSARSSSNPGSSATTRTGFVHALAYKRETTHRPRNRSAKAGENGVMGASWQVPSRVTAHAGRRARRRRGRRTRPASRASLEAPNDGEPLAIVVEATRALVVTTTDSLCSAFEDWRRVFTHARGGKGRGREGEGHEGCRAEDRRFRGAGVARACELSRSHAGRRWSCGYGHVRRLERRRDGRHRDGRGDGSRLDRRCDRSPLHRWRRGGRHRWGYGRQRRGAASAPAQNVVRPSSSPPGGPARASHRGPGAASKPPSPEACAPRGAAAASRPRPAPAPGRDAQAQAGRPYAHRTRTVQAPTSHPRRAQPAGLVVSNPERQYAAPGAEGRSGNRRIIRRGRAERGEPGRLASLYGHRLTTVIELQGR